MGKSNKKLKSERINAIRKQYDAFLEEDKKRKDRNEYILERLDKIRTSSIVVQLRNAPKDYLATANQNQFFYDRKDNMEKKLPMYEKSQYSFKPVHNSNIVTPFNEQAVMTEISKKYILIPRHANILEYNEQNDYIIKTNFDDNGDWRSKYRILEELKQNEKEHTQKSNLVHGNDSAKRNINNDELLDNNTITDPNLQISNPQYLASKFNKQSSEKQDNSGETTWLEQVNTYTENDTVSLNTEIAKQPTKTSENTTNQKQAIEIDTLARYTDIGKQPMTLKSQTSPTSKANTDLREELVNERYIEETDINPGDLTEKEKIQTEYEMKLKPKEDRHFEEVQYSNINVENQNPAEISLKTENYQQDRREIEVYEEKENSLKRNMDSDVRHGNNILNDLCTDEKSGPKDVNEPLTVDNTYYMENKNEMQENSTVQEEANKNEDAENQIESQEVPKIVYVNPGEQEFEDLGNETQIDEFEAEQTEMFYSDPNVTEYAYDQTGSVNADYTNNEGYVQEGGGSYDYYEGTPQQQVYSGEINDHEESTEQYDPHYEEQYANYEQQEQINPNADQYEVEENISQPKTYDQVQFEEPDFNVVKEVERQLDAEQNYIDSTNQDKNVNNIIDEAMIPEEQAENQMPAPVN